MHTCTRTYARIRLDLTTQVDGCKMDVCKKYTHTQHLSLQVFLRTSALVLNVVLFACHMMILVEDRRARVAKCFAETSAKFHE